MWGWRVCPRTSSSSPSLSLPGLPCSLYTSGSNSGCTWRKKTPMRRFRLTALVWGLGLVKLSRWFPLRNQGLVLSGAGSAGRGLGPGRGGDPQVWAQGWGAARARCRMRGPAAAPPGSRSPRARSAGCASASPWGRCAAASSPGPRTRTRSDSRRGPG